jgi:hypothetical protein
MPVHADTTIVILRHGEKALMDLGQLTCQGLNRSLALAPLLLGRFGKPIAIYAPNPFSRRDDHDVRDAYVRPLATIEPLAIMAGLPVNIDWAVTDIKPLAGQILTSPPGTYVVAWEHHWAESLTRVFLTRLGANPDTVPHWDDSDFDSIFVIHTRGNDEDSRRVTFIHEQQGLNGMSESCSDGSRRP